MSVGMPQGRTHYEILGVPRTADTEEIKRQYRRLVKRYHPDVATTDAAAAQRAFVRVTEAYHTLVDPQKRESYDRDLRLREAQQAHHRAQTQRPSGAAHTTAEAAYAAHVRAQAHARARQQQADRLFAEAQMDLSRGRIPQAFAALQKVLRYNPRHAGAHSLLGDIYRVQGRVEEAIRMYTLAVQLNPDSRQDLEKLERLARQNRLATEAQVHGLSSWMRLAAAVACLVFVALVFLPSHAPGDPLLPNFVLLRSWTDNLVLSMVGAGLAGGSLLVLTGYVTNLDDEFLLATVRTGGGPLPIGVLVLLVSLIFYPLAVFFYVVNAIMQESASTGMVRLLLVCTGTVVLFALALPEAAPQTLLFGGNVLFPSLLLGCLLAGMVRAPACQDL
ncbi:MAG: DnaJ domain-containing protein [Armatimonadota bacterium]|nr:DnaJ domain-containing protein [Armatimonadota bacterium]